MAKTTDFTNFATEHPNYFPGQYLLENDFELQHQYLSDRLRYQNKSLHVSGIIEGLEVTFTEDKNQVKIQSGSAIDSQGNLIVLKKEITKNIPECDSELYIEFSHKYNEDTEQQENIEDSFTRWKEEPILMFKNTTPDNAVKLAKLTISGEKITLDVEERQYSGISLPNSNGNALTLRSGGSANSNLAILTGSLKIDGDLKVEGAITPSFGNCENNGIMFAKPPGDNSGDAAWIRYYRRKGRATTLEIGSGNDAKDHIVLMPSKGNVGIGTKDPGDYKLNVNGNQYISKDLTVKGKISGNIDTVNITSGQLAIARIPVQTEPNLGDNHDAVPTVGAVYGYIQQVINRHMQLVLHLGDEIFLEMVYIPGGNFLMGSLEGNSREMPQHPVSCRPFYIGKYPLTNAQWNAVMENSIERDPALQDHPVKVSWEYVRGGRDDTFLKALTSKMKSKGNWLFRLPTEAQWEYACRAGTQTKYYFGDNEDQLGEYAWSAQNSNRETKQVGLKKPNQWGLYDMYGNVSEWCQDDWHPNYDGAPKNGEDGWFTKTGSENAVHRGGSYQTDPYYISSTARSYASRGAFGDKGFRVVAY